MQKTYQDNKEKLDKLKNILEEFDCIENASTEDFSKNKEKYNYLSNFLKETNDLYFNIAKSLQ